MLEQLVSGAAEGLVLIQGEGPGKEERGPSGGRGSPAWPCRAVPQLRRSGGERRGAPFPGEQEGKRRSGGGGEKGFFGKNVRVVCCRRLAWSGGISWWSPILCTVPQGTAS